MPEIVWLDDSQTLTYLHATVSTPALPRGRARGAIPPRRSASRRAADRRPGTDAGRPASARGDGARFLDLDLAGRFWTTSTAWDSGTAGARAFCAWTKPRRNGAGRLRRQWFAKRKNVHGRCCARRSSSRKARWSIPTPATRPPMPTRLCRSWAAIRRFGYVTATVTVHRRGCRRGRREAASVERVIQGRGFVTIPETLNAGGCVAVVRFRATPTRTCASPLSPR